MHKWQNDSNNNLPSPTSPKTLHDTQISFALLASSKAMFANGWSYREPVASCVCLSLFTGQQLWTRKGIDGWEKAGHTTVEFVPVLLVLIIGGIQCTTIRIGAGMLSDVNSCTLTAMGRIKVVTSPIQEGPCLNSVHAYSPLHSCNLSTFKVENNIPFGNKGRGLPLNAIGRPSTHES